VFSVIENFISPLGLKKINPDLSSVVRQTTPTQTKRITNMTHLASPFSNPNQFNREIGRLIDDRLIDCSLANTANQRTWSPGIDIIEADDGFTVVADVPGIVKEDIEINVHRSVLTIKGTRSASNEEHITHRERASGTFTRQLNLPESADEETVSARVTNGALEIKIPKSRKAEPIRITVTGDS
jgi:HSP20 family protein